jgi:hypothetical protein
MGTSLELARPDACSKLEVFHAVDDGILVTQ